MCNPHSTTSPKGSPTNISVTNSAHMTPTHTDENDNNNNIDEGFENDNISVTGSPPLANSSSVADDEDKRSISPLPQSSSSPTLPPQPSTALLSSPPNPSGGAFTALIQRNASTTPTPSTTSSPTTTITPLTPAFKTKSDFLSGFASHINQQQQQPNHQHHQQHVFNHALAAQLFLQSPLMPQPSQWLYSQLYGNYNDLPWFRNTLQASNNNSNFRANNSNGDTTLLKQRDLLNLGNGNGNLIKRSVTLITHRNDDMENRQSPPVSSTRRSPTPDSDVEVTSKKSDSCGAIRCRTPKHADVWRPY